jgi:hypothetical protein
VVNNKPRGDKVGFNFSRLKNWLGYENLNNTDLNNEFNNIIAKAGADTLSSANSTNGSTPTVTSMQATNNPGAVGSENISLTTQQDIQQLRYMTNLIIGGAEWYSAPGSNLTNLQAEIASLTSLPASRIVSGRVSSLGNNQPSFLVPDGTAATVYLRATTTNFEAYFNSSLETFTTDITTTGLSLAPSTNNTCVVTDTTLSGGVTTQQQGEYGSSIAIGTIGSNITSLAGNYAAFKVSTEYFIAEIENGTNTYATVTGSAGLSALANATNGSPVLTGFPPTFGIYVGMPISGTGFSGATILSFTAATITLSANFSGTSGQYTYTFLGNQVNLLSSTSGISIGQTVTGTGIPSNTVVTAITSTSDSINGYSITLSNNITAVMSGVTLTFTWFRLKNAFRGIGFDSGDNWLSRVAISSGNTITLMKLAWIFAVYNSSTPSVAVTYNKPIISYAQPTGPSTGDYWYNLNTSTWEVFNGTAYATTIACFVGICIQDTSGCKAARSTDIYKVFSALNTLEPLYLDNADVYEQSLSSKVSVYGNQYSYTNSQPIWNTTNNLDSGVSLSSSTKYYCYITDLGDLKISNIAPTARKFDLLGAYHPAKPWRAVCEFLTNGSSNITASSVITTNYHEKVLPQQFITASNIANNTITNQQILNNTITRNQLAPVLPLISGSSGSFSTTSLTYATVTNCVLNITSSGRPVILILQPDGTSNAGYISTTTNTEVTSSMNIKLLRTIFGGATSTAAIWNVTATISSTGGNMALFIPPGLTFLDAVGAGSYSYTLQAEVTGLDITALITNCVLVAFEL